jgi:hypothetical protein
MVNQFSQLASYTKEGIMSEDRFPNIMSVFGLMDGLLGCVFGVFNLVFWCAFIVFVFSIIVGSVT